MDRLGTRRCLMSLCAVCLMMAVGVEAVPARAQSGAVALDAAPLGPMPSSQNPPPMISADRSVVVIVSDKGSRPCVYVNGKAGAPYREVKILAKVFDPNASEKPSYLNPPSSLSPDGKRVAYLAQKDGGRWVAVIDQAESPEYEYQPQDMMFGPAGHRLVYIVPLSDHVLDGQFLVADGKPDPVFKMIDREHITFSPDGQHVAYVGRVDDASLVVVLDGQAQKPYYSISDLTFSPDGKRLAYVVTDAFQKPPRVILDGAELADSPPGSSAMRGSLRFSPDGKRFIFISERPDNQSAVSSKTLVEDSKPGPEFETISMVTFSPDGKELAYVGSNNSTGPAAMAQKRERGSFVVRNSKAGLAYRSIAQLAFSPDGKTLAYVGETTNNQQYVVCNDQESEGYGSVSNLVFGNAGHLAYMIQGGSIVVDGKQYPNSQLQVVASLVVSPDGKQIMCSDGSQTIVLVDNGATIEPNPLGRVTPINGSDGAELARILATDDSYSSDSHREQLMIDGQKVGAEYRKIAQVRVSEDRKHAAFVGQLYNGKLEDHVIFNGTEGPACRTVQDVALSADGSHVAYVSEEQDGTFVVVDGMKGPAFGQVLATTRDQHEPQMLKFRPDGGLEFFAVLDGKVHRCAYSAESLKSAPSMASTAATTPGLRWLHQFGTPDDDGRDPQMLVMAPDSTLYGFTTQGGKVNSGTLFRVKPDGSEYAIVHHFAPDKTDGGFPQSMLIHDGVLYGTLAQGGQSAQGAVFSFDTQKQQYAIVHHFAQKLSSPALMTVAQDGNLYGNTQYEQGVFKLKLDGSGFEILYEKSPFVTKEIKPGYFVAGDDGAFYGLGPTGTTEPRQLQGLVRMQSAGGEATVLHEFAGQPTDGGTPHHVLLFGKDGAIYGSAEGGVANRGIFYKVNRDGSNYQIIYNPKDAPQPLQVQCIDDRALYGVLGNRLFRFALNGSEPEYFEGFGAGENSIHALLVHENSIYGLNRAGVFAYQLPPSTSGDTVAGSAAPASVAINLVEPEPFTSEPITFGQNPPALPAAEHQPAPAANNQTMPPPQPQQQQPAPQPQPSPQQQQPSPTASQPPANQEKHKKKKEPDLIDAANQAEEGAKKLKGIGDLFRN